MLIVTFLATLFLELEFAILLDVLASFVVYLRRTSQPRLSIQTPDPADTKRRFRDASGLPECPQLQILPLDGSIWFGAVSHVADRFREQLARNPGQKRLLLFADGVNFVDVAGDRDPGEFSLTLACPSLNP